MNANIETWQISHQMNKLLIKAINETSLSDVSISKGRSVGEHLAHVHNVRLMWLKVAAPDLLESQKKIEKENITKRLILNESEKSMAAISELLKRGFESGRIKGFKPHPEAFLGYLVSHESHHRGQIILILKENGHIPDKKTLFGLWEWGTKSFL